MEYQFEWDENKNNNNKEKHGISFSLAKELFNDTKRITKKNIISVEKFGEQRYL